MSVEAQVREALERRRPGEALLLLARAVDALQRPQPEPELDWSLPDAAPRPLPEDDDPRVRQALERLAKDAGRKTPNVGVPTRRSLREVEVGESRYVQLPVPPPEVTARRESFARHVLRLADAQWWTTPERRLSGEEAIRAYVDGGPLWLHAWDRDFVLALPEHVRRELVRDLETHAPAEAHDLSRDILKDRNPDALRAIQTERVVRE